MRSEARAKKILAVRSEAKRIRLRFAQISPCANSLCEFRTLIQLNKTLEEIQKINVEIDLQPGKLEDLEINIGGEITELKMKTEIALHHS